MRRLVKRRGFGLVLVMVLVVVGSLYVFANARRLWVLRGRLATLEATHAARYEKDPSVELIAPLKPRGH